MKPRASIEGQPQAWPPVHGMLARESGHPERRLQPRPQPVQPLVHCNQSVRVRGSVAQLLLRQRPAKAGRSRRRLDWAGAGGALKGLYRTLHSDRGQTLKAWGCAGERGARVGCEHSSVLRRHGACCPCWAGATRARATSRCRGHTQRQVAAWARLPAAPVAALLRFVQGHPQHRLCRQPGRGAILPRVNRNSKDVQGGTRQLGRAAQVRSRADRQKCKRPGRRAGRQDEGAAETCCADLPAQ